MCCRRSVAIVLLACSMLLTPTLARAGEACGHHDEIVINSNKLFDENHGVKGGTGTPADPFVITGCTISSLRISNTSRAVRIQGNDIAWLTLNYIGDHVEVVNNRISDLRVNENVKRYGAPTSASIMRNDIGSVSQIRHFDGRFAYNTVGAPQGSFGGIFPSFSIAVNFDGFNGALFDHNTLYGALDARLHGHHHSSAFGAPSHMHAASKGKGAHAHDDDMVDHTIRYHEVTISDNTIHSAGPYALAYLDTQHDANDRTATSETDKALQAPHLHRTHVAILRNTLIGSGIQVNVFNAKDERHTKGRSQGSMHIMGNSIRIEPPVHPFFYRPSGIDVLDAAGLDLHVASNSIRAPSPKPGENLSQLLWSGEGIVLGRIDGAHLMIEDVTVTNRWYGVRATQMSRSVHWSIRNLRVSGVAEPVSYDSSVANRPEQ